jgi:cyclopropane fatty-acyl-phospholipid synthase-like methyltransferase
MGRERRAAGADLRGGDPSPGDRLRELDIGCGTGFFLRRVADHDAKPVGLDASQALLD